MSQPGIQNRILGYARERRRREGVDDQLASLRAEGCNAIFADCCVRTGQPELDKLFNLIKAGDVVVVISIDRIAGSLFELLTVLKRFNAKDCQFRSLSEPWVDSTSSTGMLTLTVLEALANLDRSLKRIAAANGRFESKAKGIHLGRSPKLTPGQRQEAIARREAGESPAVIARSYGVSRTTVIRLTTQK